jgi:hypothetical protein
VKARERLAYALKEGNNVPPFCRIQLSCKPDVIDKDIYSELQEKWQKKEQSLKKDMLIRVITKLPNSEQSYKGKVKTHNYINRQNQSTTGKL